MLQVIADHDPVDVVSRHADLDELFLDFYRESPPPEPTHARLTSPASTCRAGVGAWSATRSGWPSTRWSSSRSTRRSRHSTSLDNLVTSDPTAAALFGVTGRISSSGGWLNANIYANFFPLVMLLLTVGYGAASLAGQDEDGTLCLLATLPLRRTVIVAQKVAAMAAASRRPRRRGRRVRAHRTILRADRHPRQRRLGLRGDAA